MIEQEKISRSFQLSYLTKEDADARLREMKSLPQVHSQLVVLSGPLDLWSGHFVPNQVASSSLRTR